MPSNKRYWHLKTKRIFDILMSLVLLTLLAPIMCLTALIVSITSGWPIIFYSDRVGQDGKIFKIYKFRSMIKNAHLQEQQVRGDIPLYTEVINDPRITKIGIFLRRTALDELPQLCNVLKGDMSLVGPRPHQICQVAIDNMYCKNLTEFKPGMTGLPQVLSQGQYSFYHISKLNAFYVKKWNFGLDLWILYKTIKVVVKGHHAC